MNYFVKAARQSVYGITIHRKETGSTAYKNNMSTNRKGGLLLVLLTGMTVLLHAQQIRYVKTGATGDGSSWNNASGDLQAAITASGAGDAVWVASGIYQPAGNSSFIMKAGVKIFGGFVGGETDFSQRSLANKATLKGNGRSVISNVGNGLNASAVLDGFIITGGQAAYGGGMENNFSSSPAVSNCIFSGNTASDGGGMYNSSSASPTVTNCIFSGNTASSNGGGMFNGSSSPKITNCSFSGNRAPNGGGIYNTSSPVRITNCILYGNSSGILNVGALPTVTYSDVQDDVQDGTGNISADPRFLNAPAFATAPFTGGVYTLQSGSPAIDAGAYSSLPADITTDIAGDPRTSGGTVDMGAYEYQDAALPVLFGAVSALLKDGQLLVRWSTATETRNDHFLVQVSGDGINWKTVQAIQSKATEGNSSVSLEYSSTIPLTALSLSAGLLLLGAAVPRRYRAILSIMALVYCICVFSCSKSDRPETGGNRKLLVRIVQVDQESTKKASKVIRAVQE